MSHDVIRPIASSAASPYFDDAHRTISDQMRQIADPTDDALRDAARVGRRMGDLGLYAHLHPASVRTLCVVREALAYVSPLADAVFAVQGLALVPLAKSGRADVVKRLVAGEAIGGFALTEPEAGSDVAAMKTTARRDGDAWVLDGHKTLISNVGIAHLFVVFANADPAAGKKGISAFLVPADTLGLELRRIELSGEHPLGGLVMHGCRVPASALLGDVGGGLRLALGTLEVLRTSVGAAALGMARRALDATLAHVTTRVQFGHPLSEFQLVQAALAEMLTELESARLLVAAVARAKDASGDTTGGASVGADVAMAKMHATEAAQRIIDRAVQLHGGLGVVSGSVVEELYREVRPLRIYEGATEVLKLLVGTNLVKRYTEARS